MTKLERWVMNRVIAREVIQGFNHDKRIENLYQMIRDACIKEFYEDNAMTMDKFLRERFEATTLCEIETKIRLKKSKRSK